MKLTFVTTNKHKFQEAQAVLSEYHIELVQKNVSYDENHDHSIEEIARRAAKQLAEQFHQPVCVDDTGLEFEAFPGFPGALPKFVFKTIGLRGVLKLLVGEKRGATVTTVVGYCEPGKEPVVFKGELKGTITETIDTSNPHPHAYDAVFIAEGMHKPLSAVSLEEKNSVSHRAIAFRRLGEYLLTK